MTTSTTDYANDIHHENQTLRAEVKRMAALIAVLVGPRTRET